MGIIQDQLQHFFVIIDLHQKQSEKGVLLLPAAAAKRKGRKNRLLGKLKLFPGFLNGKI
jgi:hypothetical protein